MCLLITIFAAAITAVFWYVQTPDDRYKISMLGLIYWGASLMWLVDAYFCITEGKPFLDLSLNDALLGLTVVLCGLLAWATFLLVKSNMHHQFKDLMLKLLRM